MKEQQSLSSNRSRSNSSITSPLRHLLVSDFCQRRRNTITKRRHPSRKNNHQNHHDWDKSRQSSTFENTTIYNNGIHNNNMNDNNDNRPQVYVEILHSIPNITSPTSNSSDDDDDDDDDYHDEFATVYTKDIELLHELQIFNGQICILHHYCYDNSIISNHNHNDQQYDCDYHHHCCCSFKIPIVLKMLPDNTNVCTIQPPTNDNNNNNYSDNSDSGNHKPIYHVYVPPILAASIGIYSTTTYNSNSNNNNEVYISSTSSLLLPSIRKNPISTYTHPYHHHHNYLYNNIPIATKAEIIEIGKDPNDFITTFETICHSKLSRLNNNNRERLDDEAIKQYFVDFLTTTNDDTKSSMQNNQNNNYNHNCNGKYRLVGYGSIFGTCPIYYNDDKNIYDKKDNNGMRFYKVIYLECDDDKNVDYSNRYKLQDRIYWISQNTKLTLIHNLDDDDNDDDDDRNNNHYMKYNYMKDQLNFKRLPQRSVAKEFFQSVRFARMSQYCKNHHFSQRFDIENLRPTKNNNINSSVTLDDLMDKIMMVAGDQSCNYYGSKIALASHMLHVTCSNRNEVEHSLNVVADKLGMNILHIDGLAAFLFRQRLYSNIKSEKSKIITGSIHDKLAGIKVAFDVASKASPCLLHINLENELFEHDDQEMCDDQENRLLSTIKQQLLLHCSSQVQLLHDDVPSIFLIISTKDKLRNGPLCQSLLHSSITIKSSTESDPIGKGGKVSKTASLIPDVRWEDVGGLFHIREEIIDAIELPLKHPQLFGKSKRSGILLYGPPGTGKTLIAKAIATECNLPFISVKGPELLGSYVGESESNIRETFESARNAALNGKGAILFFDEIDSLAPRRGGVGDGGGVMERVVATFLGEMDKDLGPSTSNVDKVNTGLLFVVAATNRPDLLDPSLLRPGRFDRLVYLGVTTQRKDRVSILTSLIRKFTFEECIEASAMAEQVIDSLPESLTGAEFSAVCNGALMIAVKRLCLQADKEASKNSDAHDKRINHVGEIITHWNKEQRTPKVTQNDFLLAAEKIVPMTSEEVLKSFEDLRLKFQT